MASSPAAPVEAATPPLDDAPQAASADPRVLLSMPQDAETVEALARAFPRLRVERDPLAGQVEAALVHALADPSEDVRAAAVGGLGAAAGEHAGRLAALYDVDPSPSVRSEVVYALSGCQEFIRRVQATDRDADVRRFASEVSRMVHSE